MKKLSMFFAALVMMLSQFGNSNAQLPENFSSLTFPPTGWTITFTGTNYWTRNIANGFAQAGSGSAKFDFFNASAGTIQSLETPVITASTAGQLLKFSQSYRTYTGGELDSLFILSSTDGGTTYSTLVILPGSPTAGVGMATRNANTSSAAPTLASEWATRGYVLPTGTNKIRFDAHSDFGNNLFIDSIRIESPPAIPADISAVSIDAPTGTIGTSTVIPLASFSNVGGANQVNVPVKCIITGPVNFTGTAVIPSILVGGSVQASFSSPSFTPTAGSYNIKVISELATDGNRSNDTLNSTFTVIDFNYGSGTGGIFYANSIATGAPSMPEVCWPDYSGGTYLCLDGVNNDPSVFTGTLDDGYWKLGNVLPAGYSIRVNGVDYDSIFPSTNGIIGLTDNSVLTDFSPGALPDAGQSVALYPLWKDFHFVALQGNTYIKYMVRGSKLYIFWLGATYNSGNLSLDRVFFSAAIELLSLNSGNGTMGISDSKISYQYGDLSRGTSASFVTAVNNNTLADHVIGLQSGAGFYAAYRQRITTISIPGPIFSTPAGGSLAVAFGPAPSDFGDKKCASLTVTVSLQKCPSDTITASLYDAGSCSLIDTKKAYFTGSGSVKFDMAGVDNVSNYVIKVTQKNSMEIWSNQFSFTGYAASYDFTSAQTQEAAGNLIFNGSDWSMISGDVNQDGAIDASDLAAVENDTEFGIPTIYPTDLNCDDFVDASDLASCENNQGIFSGAPCAPAPSDNIRKVGPNDRQIFLPEVDKSVKIKLDTNPNPDK